MTFYFVPFFIAIAHKFGVIDRPDGNLKKHKEPTPYLGGVALYLGFISALALTFPFENMFFLFLIGTTFLLFIGLIDDLIVMKPHQKLIGQIIATFCFLKAGFYLKELFFSYIPNILISFFWILYLINAFNLIDVMDGLCTITAIVATFSFFVSALVFQNYSVALLLSIFLGSLIAFFWYNRPPARIYLGDAGSLFIGGFLAAIPFMLPWSIYNPYGFITPIIFLMVPILEVGTLILIRTYKCIPFYKGSPDHFSLYLQRNNWTKNQILLYTVCFSLILFMTGLLFMLNIISLYFTAISIFGLILVWYAFLLP